MNLPQVGDIVTACNLYDQSKRISGTVYCVGIFVNGKSLTAVIVPPFCNIWTDPPLKLTLRFPEETDEKYKDSYIKLLGPRAILSIDGRMKNSIHTSCFLCCREIIKLQKKYIH